MMTHLKQDKSTPKLLNSRLCVCVCDWKRERNGLATAG